MKVRAGFVSNSSSSSFLILMDKNDFTSMTGNLSPFVLAVTESLMEDVRFAGKDCVSISYVNGNYSWYEDCDRDSIRQRTEEIAKARGVTWVEDEDEWCEATYALETAVTALGDKVFTHSEEF